MIFATSALFLFSTIIVTPVVAVRITNAEMPAVQFAVLMAIAIGASIGIAALGKVAYLRLAK